MNRKRLAGLVIFLVGIAMIVIALVIRYRVEGAESNINQGTGLVSETPIVSPIVKGVGGILRGEAEEYRTPMRILLIGGIALAVIGAGLMIFCCSRKKR